MKRNCYWEDFSPLLDEDDIPSHIVRPQLYYEHCWPVLFIYAMDKQFSKVWINFILSFEHRFYALGTGSQSWWVSFYKMFINISVSVFAFHKHYPILQIWVINCLRLSKGLRDQKVMDLKIKEVTEACFVPRQIVPSKTYWNIREALKGTLLKEESYWLMVLTIWA